MPKWKLTLADTAVAFTLIAVAVAGRMVWHPAQVAPVAAAALFAGFYLRSRWLAMFVPLAAMAISDMWLGAYNFKIMMAVYLGLCVPVLLASVLRRDLTLPRLIGCSLAASVVHFVLSNGAEWAYGSLYTHDAEGLALCFYQALPFFRNTMVGDLLWTSVFFAVHGLIASRWRITPPSFETFDTLAPVRVRK
jgi:hypothetical protein